MKATYQADSKAGLLLLSGDGARLDEWRPGASEEVERFELGRPMTGSHELQGPAASHPRGSGEKAPGTHSSPQRDLFERRLEQHRVAFVRDVAGRCAVVARERGWPLVLVLGDPHLTAPAADALRHGGVEVEQSNRFLAWKTHHELALAVGPDVERALLEHAAGAATARS